MRCTRSTVSSRCPRARTTSSATSRPSCPTCSADPAERAPSAPGPVRTRGRDPVRVRRTGHANIRPSRYDDLVRSQEPHDPFEKANVTYDGGVSAMKDLDLEIGDGEFVVIVGLSGAGKSTLIRAINGLVPLTSGTLRGQRPRRAEAEPEGTTSAALRDRHDLPGLQPGRPHHRAQQRADGTTPPGADLADADRQVPGGRHPDRRPCARTGRDPRSCLRPGVATCRAASASGSASPVHWPRSPRSSSPTSRSPRSIRRRATSS